MYEKWTRQEPQRENNFRVTSVRGKQTEFHYGCEVGKLHGGSDSLQTRSVFEVRFCILSLPLWSPLTTELGSWTSRQSHKKMFHQSRCILIYHWLKDYSLITGPQIVLLWLSIRIFFQIQSEFCVHSTTEENFIIEQYYKPIRELFQRWVVFLQDAMVLISFLQN